MTESRWRTGQAGVSLGGRKISINCNAPSGGIFLRLEILSKGVRSNSIRIIISTANTALCRYLHYQELPNRLCNPKERKYGTNRLQINTGDPSSFVVFERTRGRCSDSLFHDSKGDLSVGLLRSLRLRTTRLRTTPSSSSEAKPSSTYE